MCLLDSTTRLRGSWKNLNAGFGFGQRHQRFLRKESVPQPPPRPQVVIRRLLEVEEMGSFSPLADAEMPTVCKGQTI